MNKKLEIRINTLEKAGQDFIKTWHLAEKSRKGLETKEFLTFDNLQSLLKVLTPKRLALLQELYRGNV